MTFLGELKLVAVLESLRTVSHFVNAIGDRLELNEKTLFDIELAVDEAATNIVMHAYAGLSPGLMVVSAEIQSDTVRITLTDWGRPLNPDRVYPFDITAPIETRIRGGMGLHFISTLMDSITRTPAQVPGDPNALILTKRIERLQPGSHRASSTQELNAILNVSQVMANSTDLDRLLERIIDELVGAIDAERGTLYLVDKAREELSSRVLMEDTEKLREIRLKIGEGIAGQVAADGKVRNIKDVTKHPMFNPLFDSITHYKTRTMLVAPMKNHNGEIIGVVQLLNKRDGRFTARDERLLGAIAAQAAISIENARLYAQEIEQQLINQELETARRIQMSFLPQTLPQHEDWDVAAYWHPVREVAGDFYDFYTIPDGRMAVVIADVSGKGVPAALFMALSVTVLRFAMTLGFSPAEMIDHANRIIVESQQSRMFTTAFVGYIDFPSGVMKFASAGHNPPILFQNKTHACHYTTTTGVAMGVFSNARFVEARVTIGRGDTLVLYTDGITEAVNADDEEFGESRLEDLITQYAPSHSAQELVDLIVRAAMEFAGEQGTFDDETLIVIKRKV